MLNSLDEVVGKSVSTMAGRVLSTTVIVPSMNACLPTLSSTLIVKTIDNCY
jgi:hypothetical protein